MSEAAVPASGLLTYAVGDVHGCLDKLKRLMARCREHGGRRPARYVFIGDYVDRGPNPRGVIDLLRALQAEMEVICLRGNHEALMLQAAQGADGLIQWLTNGGGRTLASYGVEHPADLPAEHLDWAAKLPLSFDDGRRFFVHAGVDPATPLDRQNEHDQLWIREPFLSSTQDFGRLIVHGHTPLSQGRPDLRRNRLNIDTAAVMGGPLTAAVFTESRTAPVAFLTDQGRETEVVQAAG